MQCNLFGKGIGIIIFGYDGCIPSYIRIHYVYVYIYSIKWYSVVRDVGLLGLSGENEMSSLQRKKRRHMERGGNGGNGGNWKHVEERPVVVIRKHRNQCIVKNSFLVEMGC